MKKLFFCLFTLLVSISVCSQDLNLIPKPEFVERKEGVFTINAATQIFYNQKDVGDIINFLNEFLDENYGFKLSEKHSLKDQKRGIQFILDSKATDESYNLSINNNAVIVKGGKAGLFYGLQTLLQLMPLEKTSAIQLPQLEVNDKPRFGYRGAMLDVGRYFFTVDEVKRFIDLMAHYKLNIFHWHLTEDAGWRIEIDKYPLLTEIGAWRRGTQREHPAESFDRLPHGGYYTKEQIKDVVAYAQKRNINIIPEFDMPGHTLAVLAAYTELSCTGGPFKVLENWGIQQDVLCAGNEKTYEFIEDVLDEILEMFPYEIIHIGGDEAPKDRWKACPKCQQKMKDEGLKNEDELQSYFVKRVGTYLQGKNRKMLGWDEIMEGGLAPNAMVMSWRGEEAGIEAAGMQHEVVMSPTSYMYLDYYQGAPEAEPINIGGHVTLERVYSFEPVSPKISLENQKYIVGLQGNLWMEFIHSQAKLDYMAFPRLLAVAEVGWSSKEKDFQDFRQRVRHNLQWLDKKGVNFRIPDAIVPQPTQIKGNEIEVELNPSIEGAKLYYTLNGQDPMQYGKLYNNPVKIDVSDKDIELKYIIRTKTGRVSGTRSIQYKKTDNQ